MSDMVNAICGIDCKPWQAFCNGYCMAKAEHPPLIQRQEVSAPSGSNADEWLLFLTEYPPEFVAVQIAERLDEIERLRADLARPKVKPLAWVERRGDCYQAGPYQVCSNHNSGGMWRVKLHGRVILKRIRGLEKAQEWASKHHEAHILSALEGYE